MKFEFCTPMPLDVAEKAWKALNGCPDPKPSIWWHGGWTFPTVVDSYPIVSDGRGEGMGGLGVVVDLSVRDTARATLRTWRHRLLCKMGVLRPYYRLKRRPRFPF